MYMHMLDVMAVQYRSKLCCFCSIMSTSDEFICNCETVNIVIIYTLLIVTFTHLHVHNVNSATVPVK